MKNDDHLIFEAYQSYKDYVQEKRQENKSARVDIGKAQKALDSVNQSTDELNQAIQDIFKGNINVSNPGPTSSTPQEPSSQAGSSATTPGVPQPGEVKNQTNTAAYLPPVGTNTPSTVAPRAPESEAPATPAPAATTTPTPAAPSNIYSGKGGQTGTSSAQVQPATTPAGQYSGKGQAPQTQNPQDIINMERERAAAASATQPQQAPTAPALANASEMDPRSQKFVMTSKGRRMNLQYNPYRDPNNPNFKVA